MRKIFKGVSISIITTILLLALMYSVIALKGYFMIKKERKHLKMGVNEIFLYNEELGYVLKKDTSVNYEFPGSGITLQRSADQYGRRPTVLHPSATEHAIFFGCSYTYGQGCNDWETMPWKLSEMDSTINVYNYALEGYGTQHMYDILQRGIDDEIEEPTGTAFYMYIEHHRIRSCYGPLVSKWGYDFNGYEINKNGALYKRGKFHELYRPHIYFWKGLREMGLWNAVFPVVETVFGDRALNISIDDFQLVVSLVLQSRDLYLAQFPGGRFVVVIFPGENTGMGAVLVNLGVEVLDLSKAVDLHAIDGIQKDGFHPNETGNIAVAELIRAYLIANPLPDRSVPSLEGQEQ